jgi:beta-lactamase class A
MTRLLLTLTLALIVFAGPSLSVGKRDAELADLDQGIPATPDASAATLDDLAETIADISTKSKGIVGVGILDLESGIEFYQNADVFFPMASTYKIAIAAKILSDVQNGDYGLETMLDVEERHWVSSPKGISATYRYIGLSFSVENLVEMMITVSDNTATDMLFYRAGGGKEITAYLRSISIQDMRVDRSTAMTTRDYYGIKHLPPEEDTAIINQMYDNYSAEERATLWADTDEKNRAFDVDPKDISTPGAMVQLLAMIWRGEILNEELTQRMKGTMSRTSSSTKRLPELLPDGTPVAHKPGGIGWNTNDVGVIKMPDGSELVIVVFVRGATMVSRPESSVVIAEIARAAYEYFSNE